MTSRMNRMRTGARRGLARGLTAGLTAGALALAGCNDFLSADKSVADPNNPTIASRNQLLVGAGANLMALEESAMAMIICQWMQQCAGNGGRFVEEQANYTGITEASFNTTFESLYSGGGLIQLRQIQRISDEQNDKVSKGIAEVMEAMVIGYGADIWGDIPYREASSDTSTAPHFDPQMQVYDDLQATLDRAITDLAGGGAGPGPYDIFFQGDATKWTQLAYTVKARFYLHTVEKLGADQYTKALAAAQKGISAPANDFNDPHTSATSERNMWAQFQLSSFGNDLVAGKPLVDLMKAQGDSARLVEYFGKNPAGKKSHDNDPAWKFLDGYGGYDQATGTTLPDSISPVRGSGRTDNAQFAQPIVTYDENQLIIAEATFSLQGPAAAAPFLNAVRARYGKAAIAAPTLADIMAEKYIALFQNPEYWNDYRRTCYPALRPAAGKASIPARFYNPQSETQTNPNAPNDSELNLFTMRNANDPNGCPVP